MNSTMAMRATRELPRILIFGLSGFFVGLLSDGAMPSLDRGKPAVEVCRDVSSENTGDTANIAQSDAETKVGRPAMDESGLRGPGPVGREEIAVSAEDHDLEERIHDTLLVDEIAAEQQNEQPHGDDVDNDPTEHIRTMTAEKQLEYVKAIAGDRDDASIVELKDLILFEDESVRHAAIDTLIEILGQETGHYDAIEAVLAEYSMFMDDGQISRATEITLKVDKKRERVSTEQD